MKFVLGQYVFIVEKRYDDWIAYREGNRATWESAQTFAEAIGKLVISLAVLERWTPTVESE